MGVGTKEISPNHWLNLIILFAVRVQELIIIVMRRALSSPFFMP